MAPPKAEPHQSLIGAEARHNQAWAEANTRIQIRQTVALTYSTIAWTVLAYVLGRPAEPASPVEVDWVGFALPGLGLVAALWTVHNDRIIGLLGAYCAVLQTWPTDKGVPPLPSWHDPGHRWIGKALKYRRLSDAAFIIVLAASTVPGIREMASRSKQSRFAGSIIMFGVALGLTAAVLVSSNWYFREFRMKKFGFRLVDDKWQFTDQAGPSHRDVV